MRVYMCVCSKEICPCIYICEYMGIYLCMHLVYMSEYTNVSKCVIIYLYVFIYAYIVIMCV